jgi:hypothetical protein
MKLFLDWMRLIFSFPEENDKISKNIRNVFYYLFNNQKLLILLMAIIHYI